MNMNQLSKLPVPVRFRRWRKVGKVAVALALTPGLCLAEDVAITVTNGNFETAANNGSIGGNILLGVVGPDVPTKQIGSGPWSGATYGILGLVSPPVITINDRGAQNGYCSVTGLVGLKLLNIPLLNTKAVISQTLSTQAEPYVIYTLEADVDRLGVLSAALLAQDGVGIGLTINGTEVASSLTASGSFLTVQLLTGTSYHITLKYATSETPPAGPLGIRLFTGEGSALLHLGAIGDVIFDNVKLTATKLEA